MLRTVTSRETDIIRREIVAIEPCATACCWVVQWQLPVTSHNRDQRSLPAEVQGYSRAGRELKAGLPPPSFV